MDLNPSKRNRPRLHPRRIIDAITFGAAEHISYLHYPVEIPVIGREKSGGRRTDRRYFVNFTVLGLLEGRD